MRTKKCESELNGSSDSPVPIQDKELGSRISAATDLLGTRMTAASVADVSVDMLAKYIAGTSRPRFDAMVKLASAAGVSLDWLATGEGPKMRQAAQTPDSGGVEGARAPAREPEAPPVRRQRFLIEEAPAEIVRRVLDELESQGVKLPSAVFSDLVQLVLMCPDEAGGHETIARILRCLDR